MALTFWDNWSPPPKTEPLKKKKRSLWETLTPWDESQGQDFGSSILPNLLAKLIPGQQAAKGAAKQAKTAWKYRKIPLQVLEDEQRGLKRALGLGQLGVAKLLPGTQGIERSAAAVRAENPNIKLAELGGLAWERTDYPSIKAPFTIAGWRPQVGMKGAALQLYEPTTYMGIGAGKAPLKAAQEAAVRKATTAAKAVRGVAPEVRTALEDIAAQGKPTLRPAMGIKAGGKVPKKIPIQATEPKNLWELTPEELDVASQQTKVSDRQIVKDVFGERAQEYERLYRKANSTGSDLSGIDAAATKLAQMEDSLSEVQRNRLFGIGEAGASVEDLQAYRQALGSLDWESPEALGRSLGKTITNVGTKTNPLEMTFKEQIAYAQLRYAREEAIRLGWNLKTVEENAFRTAAQRFGNAEDARFMLQRFLTAIKQPQAGVFPKTLEAQQAFNKPPRPPRRPLWADIANQPPEPPKPPTTTAAPGELPSGRKPGSIANQIPLADKDPLLQLTDALTPETRSLRTKVGDIYNTAMSKMYDPNWALGPLEKETGVPTHQLAQVVSGAPAYGENLLRKYIRPVLTPVAKDIDALEQYMVLKRSEDILARNPHAVLPGGIDGWNGVMRAEKQLEAKLGTTRFAAIQGAAEQMWKANRDIVLTPLKNEGIISAQTYRNLVSSHPHYIDFHRADFSVVDTADNLMRRPTASVSSDTLKAME